MTQEIGSIVNHVYSQSKSFPEVGEGATMGSWSDRYAATVVEVFEKGVYTYAGVQEDFSKIVSDGGIHGIQAYEYTPNPDAFIDFWRSKDGTKWERCVQNAETGRWVKRSYGSIYFGRRDSYYDPHF